MSWKPHILARLKGAWASRTEPENMRTIAAVYWEILMLCAIVVVVGIIALAMQELSVVVEAQNPPSPAQTAGGPALDPVQLDATLSQYVQRAAQYRATASSTAALADPAK